MLMVPADARRTGWRKRESKSQRKREREKERCEELDVGAFGGRPTLTRERERERESLFFSIKTRAEKVERNGFSQQVRGLTKSTQE